MSYCKMFVDAAPKTVVPVLEAVLRQELDDRDAVTVSGVDIEVNRNKDAFGPAATVWRAGGGSSFILWPALVEFDNGDEDATPEMVDVTARILTALWEDGQPAVAACDYEDQLPWSGGIQRLDD